MAHTQPWAVPLPTALVPQTLLQHHPCLEMGVLKLESNKGKKKQTTCVHTHTHTQLRPRLEWGLESYLQNEYP